MAPQFAPPAGRGLPIAAWTLAWSSLADQIRHVADVGLRDAGADVGVLPSVAIGAALVYWFSAGVLRARPVRSFVVLVVLAIAFLGAVAGLVLGRGSEDPPGAVLTIIEFVSLLVLVRSDYYRWRKYAPDAPGPSLTGPLLIGVAVGALAGLANVPG